MAGYSETPLPRKLGIAAGHRVAFPGAPSSSDASRRLQRPLTRTAGLWIAWPKRSSGVTTDLTEDVVREIAIANAMVDNEVCAIDDTWSGLRLVYRLRDRPPR